MVVFSFFAFSSASCFCLTCSGVRPWPLGGLLLLLLQVEVEGVFVERDLKSVDVKEFLVGFDVVGALVERDVIGACRNAQGEILALLVGLEGVFLAIVLVGVDHDAIRDGIAVGSLHTSLDGSRSLGETWRHTQSQH